MTDDNKSIESLDAQLVAIQERINADLIVLTEEIGEVLVGKRDTDRLAAALERVRETSQVLNDLPMPSAVIDPEQPDVVAPEIPVPPPPNPPLPPEENQPLPDESSGHHGDHGHSGEHGQGDDHGPQED